MRWKSDKIRFTVDELALHFGMKYMPMYRLVKKSKVDMRKASDVLMFVSTLTHEMSLIKVAARLHEVTEN